MINTLFNEDDYLTIANRTLNTQSKYKNTTLLNNYKKNNYNKGTNYNNITKQHYKVKISKCT